MRIGFVGLGSMGTGMASNLLKAGHEVAVWNRSAGKTGALVAAGAREAASLAEVSEGAAVVCTMLADDKAALGVVLGEDRLLAGLSPGAIHVSHSTISVVAADTLAIAHVGNNQRFVSAPVFGRPDAAASAKLFVVAAGAAADIDAVQPVLDVVAQKTFRVGERPSAANVVKLCGNFAILAAIEGMAEAMALAQKSGVAKAALLEVLTGSLLGCPIYVNYGRILVEERFVPGGFKAPLALKDMRLAGEVADAVRVPMPLLSLLHDHLVETIAKEGEDIDWSGIGRTVYRNAGL